MGSNIGKYYRLPSATAFFAPQRPPSSRRRDSLLRAAATAVLAPLQQPSSRRRDCCRRAAVSAVVAPPRLPSLRRRVCLPRATPCSKIWCAVGTASSSVQFARTPPVGFEAILASGGGVRETLTSLGHVRTNTHGRICSIVCAAPPPPPLVLSLLRKL